MTLILILVLTIICKILLDLYMQTKSGYLLRAVGDNHVLVTSLAKDQGNVKILGLAISNDGSPTACILFRGASV